jgi:hypothetical protein
LSTGATADQVGGAIDCGRVDPERAPLITEAFELAATGRYSAVSRSMNIPLDDIDLRGLDGFEEA